MAAMARLTRIWRCNTVSYESKFNLYKSPVTSILLYGCKTCTLFVDSGKKKDSGFRKPVHEETSPYPLLGAQDHRLGAEQDQLLSGSTGTSSGNCQETETGMVQACHSLSTTILHCILEGGRRRGRQRKCWMDNIKEWTALPTPELLMRFSRRKVRKKISAESSLLSP